MGVSRLGGLLAMGTEDAVVLYPLVLLCRDTSREVYRELEGKACGLSNGRRLRDSPFHLSWSVDTYEVFT